MSETLFLHFAHAENQGDLTLWNGWGYCSHKALIFGEQKNGVHLNSCHRNNVRIATDLQRRVDPNIVTGINQMNRAGTLSSYIINENSRLISHT